jgi:hypothetical protein
MKVIPMEKKEDWILGAWVLKKIFGQDDEKAFLFIQVSRKKGLVSNQILKLLKGLWRKEIGKLRTFRTAGGLSTAGNEGPYEEHKGTKPHHQEQISSHRHH